MIQEVSKSIAAKETKEQGNIISRDPEYSYKYARAIIDNPDVKGCRPEEEKKTVEGWPKEEKSNIRDPKWSFEYVETVLKDMGDKDAERWPYRCARAIFESELKNEIDESKCAKLREIIEKISKL